MDKKQWRPEGWMELKFGGIKTWCQNFSSSDAYEAGADAMLNGLRNSEGRHHISSRDHDIPCKLPELYPGQVGYVVFIPDEE